MNGFKKLKSLLITYLLFSAFSVFPQQIDESIEAKVDTIFRYQGINPTLNIDYQIDNLILDKNHGFIQHNLPLYNDSSTIWLRTELALSSSLLFEEKVGTDQHFTSILYQKHLEDSKFDPVRYVLGMVQLGAVGYLAYKHIKKYGFWK